MYYDQDTTCGQEGHEYFLIPREAGTIQSRQLGKQDSAFIKVQLLSTSKMEVLIAQQEQSGGQVLLLLTDKSDFLHRCLSTALCAKSHWPADTSFLTEEQHYQGGLSKHRVPGSSEHGSEAGNWTVSQSMV